MVPSLLLPVAMVVPSGLRATERGRSVCPNRMAGCELRTATPSISTSQTASNSSLRLMRSSPGCEPAASGAKASRPGQEDEACSEPPKDAARLHSETGHFPPFDRLAIGAHGHQPAIRSEQHRMQAFPPVVETETVADAA